MVHERRGISLRHHKRERVDPDAIIPIRIALRQSNLVRFPQLVGLFGDEVQQRMARVMPLAGREDYLQENNFQTDTWKG